MFGYLLEASEKTTNQLGNSDLSGNENTLVRIGTRMGRCASALVLVAGLAACSTAPDWAKPGLIYGDDAAAASADPTSEKDFPELADVPAKPTPSSTAAERREAAEGLAADRERARYSDEVLRGGTEAPAQAPRSAAPAPAPVIATRPVTPAPVAAAPVDQSGIIPAPERGGRALPSAASAVVETPQNRAAETTAVEVVPTAPAPAPVVEAPARPASPAPVVATAPAAPAAPAPVAAQPARRAAVPALSERERAARAEAQVAASRELIDDRVGEVNAAAAAVQASTAARLTPTATVSRANDRFEASSAPALNNEALEAAGPIVSSRYGTPASTTIGSADPEDPVEVNLDALRGLPGPGASLQPSNGPGVTAAYGAQGGPGNIPPYVVNFGHGSVHLSAGDREKVAQAAEAALGQGGIVRVVGHASSRTGDLGVGKHLLANFKASLDRATAVADELIRNGVDPSMVFVEAKGDTVPVYYESMPAGEAGNRRAEIFIE